VGLDSREYVHIDESLQRGTAELHNLVGDPARARSKLGWAPTVTFEQLVQVLVDAELERLRRESEFAAT
jgi:GDPmannose 4,6-dehydratase